jgi:hypothetical protein
MYERSLRTWAGFTPAFSASCSDEQVSWPASISPRQRKYRGRRDTVAAGILDLTDARLAAPIGPKSGDAHYSART